METMTKTCGPYPGGLILTHTHLLIALSLVAILAVSLILVCIQGLLVPSRRSWGLAAELHGEGRAFGQQGPVGQAAKGFHGIYSS